MYITSHAAQRYKKRFANKRTPKKKVIAAIQKSLKQDFVNRKPLDSPGYYAIFTKTFQAVCWRGRVITILHLKDDANRFVTKPTLREMLDRLV